MTSAPDPAVRPATEKDVSRIAEILVFGKRTAYRPIFRDDAGSFNDLQVIDIIRAYESRPALLSDVLVYDDGIVRGMLRRGAGARPGEIELMELYVEPCFTGTGVGHALMRRFLDDARQDGRTVAGLWVLEQNAPARRFYESFGFMPDGQPQRIDGTDVMEMRYRKELRA